ncbi:DivIVA domain-containing protein [Thermatribacter velox]|uniref:DivIVA domain-containing protein n=1 Tax=Thermatribacter velox TaxID=3039681 RepID=A0ABZ2Y820_9BACT
MSLQPEDLLQIEFGTAFRGYNREEVDEFLEEIASYFQELLNQQAKLTQENEFLKQKLHQQETEIQRLKAKQEELKKQIEAEKDLLQKEAQMIVAEARLKAQNLLGEAERKKYRLELEYRKLLEQYRQFQLRFKALLQTFLESLNQYEKELPEISLLLDSNASQDSIGEVVRFSLEDFQEKK